MKILHALLVASIAVAPFFVPTAAHAVDNKSYPGMACKPYNGSMDADFLFTPDGITNITNADRDIICPIVYDGEEAALSNPPPFPGPVVMSVAATAGASVGELSCTAQLGSKATYGATTKTVKQAIGANQRGGFVMDDLTVHGNYYFLVPGTITCRLPKGFTLTRYHSRDTLKTENYPW